MSLLNSPSAVLDHVGDTNATELLRLQKLYPLPDFVKRAGVDTLKPDVKALPPTAFAHPTERLYPCHTAASTFLSALYFTEKKADFVAEYDRKTADRVQQRLDGLSRYWGIDGAVKAMQTKSASMRKDADSDLPDADFAYVWAGDDGVKHRHWRMGHAAEVKRAAECLLEYRDQLPYRDRCTVARKIMTKAAQYGVDLEPELDHFIERQAGYGLCDSARVSEMIRQRAAFCQGPNAYLKDTVIKVAESALNAPRATLDPSALAKLAAAVDDLDGLLGLRGKYTEMIRRPEDVIFEVTLKEAKDGEAEVCTLTTGRVYARSDFKKIALDDLQDLFGNDIVGAVADGLEVDPVKMAFLAETLPRPSAETFENLLTEKGVKPVHFSKRAEARPESVIRDAAALAATY